MPQVSAKEALLAYIQPASARVLHDGTDDGLKSDNRDFSPAEDTLINLLIDRVRGLHGDALLVAPGGMVYELNHKALGLVYEVLASLEEAAGPQLPSKASRTIRKKEPRNGNL